MPKEYIGQHPQEWGSIQVAWGRDCSTIQLAVAGPIGWRDDVVLTTAREFDPDAALDWHFTFRHRREINDLIELLRKARDQAFGKDA